MFTFSSRAKNMSQKPMRQNTPSYLVNLPMEIHFRVRDYLLRDPYTRISQLRILRLVCRLFDIIWFPVVLNNILLFKSDQTPHDRVKVLRSLVDGKSNTLSCTALTLQDWECLDTDIHRFLLDIKDTWLYAPDMVECGTFLKFMVPFSLLASPAMWLCKFLLRPRKCFTNARDCIRSRYYASLLSRKGQFAHIRHVKMTVSENQSRWAVYRSSRILSALPQLTELDLYIHSSVNLECIVQCLNHVTSICTFTLRMEFTTARIRCLRHLIARNPDLTCLTLMTCGFGSDLSELFLDVPPHKALKLDHVSLYGHGYCKNPQALIPHIQALSSFEFTGSIPAHRSILAEFIKAKIYPQTISVAYLDLHPEDVVFTFLRNHPGLISLSFFMLQSFSSSDYINMNERMCSILVQHSKTLRSLKMPRPDLSYALRASSNEMNFLQFTNLREIVFTDDPEPKSCRNQENDVDIKYEKQIFPIIAQLDPSLAVGFMRTVVVRTSVRYCHASDNPLVRDLAGRLFFLEGPE